MKDHNEITNAPIEHQIALLKIDGISQKEIAKRLNLTELKVSRIIASKAYRKVAMELADAATSTVKAVLKARVASLGEEIFKALRSKLAEGNMKAVEVSLRVLGFEDAVENKGDTLIQVNLPTAAREKTVNTNTIEIEGVTHGDTTEG